MSLILMIRAGWLLLFPKVTLLETTGPYQGNREDCFFTDASRLEAYAKDGSFRELPVSFWYPTAVPEFFLSRILGAFQRMETEVAFCRRISQLIGKRLKMKME